MIEKDQLKEYGLTFGFEDDENKVFVYSVMHELIHERYEKVRSIEISQLGGTTFIATFDAKDERALKPILDADHEKDAWIIRRRLLATEHILNKF